MNFRVLVVLTCVFGICSLGCSAPSKTASDTSARATTPGPGVNISPVTRNQSRSTTTLQLARDGKALLPIVISNNASDATKKVAAELAEYLKQISGATFQIQTGDGSSGIVLGSLTDSSWW